MKRLPLITELIFSWLFVPAILFYFKLGAGPKLVGKVVVPSAETPSDSNIKNDYSYADYGCRAC